MTYGTAHCHSFLGDLFRLRLGQETRKRAQEEQKAHEICTWWCCRRWTLCSFCPSNFFQSSSRGTGGAGQVGTTTSGRGRASWDSLKSIASTAIVLFSVYLVLNFGLPSAFFSVFWAIFPCFLPCVYHVFPHVSTGFPTRCPNLLPPSCFFQPRHRRGASWRKQQLVARSCGEKQRWLPKPRASRRKLGRNGGTRRNLRILLGKILVYWENLWFIRKNLGINWIKWENLKKNLGLLGKPWEKPLGGLGFMMVDDGSWWETLGIVKWWGNTLGKPGVYWEDWRIHRGKQFDKP